MGMLVNGQWADKWYSTKEHGGRFVRKPSQFRDWVTADGSTPHAPESGRYHLYISHACPWAHRTLIFRALKGLEHAIDISVVNWRMGQDGWTFEPALGVVADPVHQATRLHQVYTHAQADFTGRVTVPILWDKQLHTIVNNESSEIIRMFNSAFNGVAEHPELDLWPESLRAPIEAVNEVVYESINNGVYRCGFATSQEAYDEAANALFAALDQMEERLGLHRYLVGDTMTEADWRLFTTLLRFDKVYHTHFKCNRRMIKDYPNLWGFTRELYQVPGVADTVHFDHIIDHYYQSHETINPHRIVPIGPNLDFAAPHGRG